MHGTVWYPVGDLSNAPLLLSEKTEEWRTNAEKGFKLVVPGVIDLPKLTTMVENYASRLEMPRAHSEAKGAALTWWKII